MSFAIEPGELFGLLGPNGAGKTTTIKMLITLLLPTSGSATILGLDVVRDAREVRRQIGYVLGGDRGLYERLSALDNLRYFAELYAVPPRDQRTRIGELLELVGLTGREKERVEGFSRGMRQQMCIRDRSSTRGSVPGSARRTSSWWTKNSIRLAAASRAGTAMADQRGGPVRTRLTRASKSLAARAACSRSRRAASGLTNMPAARSSRVSRMTR